MEEIILDVLNREHTGRSKAKDIREEGFIPAVVYAQGKESLNVKVPHREFGRLLHQHRIESVVITVRVEGDKKEKSCLIKEIQYDPVHGNVWHVDFNEISLTKTIKVRVPVVAQGDAVGVKQDGGSLEHVMWEIEVECLPKDIPKQIEVDVTQLKIGDAIHIKDISLPAQVKVLHAADAIVISVAAPIKEEVAAAPVEGEEKQEPEVIKEKKETAAEGEPEAKGK
jgi:large subunit ribosomal protein L25